MGDSRYSADLKEEQDQGILSLRVQVLNHHIILIPSVYYKYLDSLGFVQGLGSRAAQILRCSGNFSVDSDDASSRCPSIGRPLQNFKFL